MKIDQIKEFYSTDSSVYDDRWIKKGGDYTNKKQIAIVKQLTKNWKNKNLLEIGCGSGRFSAIIIQSNPATVFMDLSEAMLEVTLRKVGRSCKGLNASVYKIPGPSSSFDAILSINVFNHIEGLEKAFSEVYRVLVDEGELVINFTNIFSYFILAGAIVNLKGKSIGRKVYSRWLIPRKLETLLKDSGFEITERIGNVFVPMYLDVPILREFIIFLDKISSHSFLRSFCPSIFVKCKKVSNASAN